MNFFSSPVFLESLAQTRFAGRRTRIRDYQVEGHRFRLLEVDGRPLTRFPFLDFVEPVSAPSGAVQSLRYLPYVSLARVPCDGVKPEQVVSPLQASPLVDWSQVKTPEALDALIKSRRSNLISDSAKRERKLAAERGPVTYLYDDRAEDVFALGTQWKSSQFLKTGHADDFFRLNLPLFEELRRRGVFIQSSLRAGGKLVATIWSAIEDGRLYYWVPSYDASLSAFSPGRLLLEKLLRDSQARGHTEFDFLIGDESYKWFYATHTRVVGPVGKTPLRLRVEREAKRRIKKLLANHPRLLEEARSLKRRLRL